MVSTKSKRFVGFLIDVLAGFPIMAGMMSAVYYWGNPDDWRLIAVTAPGVLAVPAYMLQLYRYSKKAPGWDWWEERPGEEIDHRD